MLLLWALLYLPGIFTPELKGEEPRRALVAYEMIQSGDWMQPRIAGEIYDNKPPLFNWLIAGSWLVFGTESEGAARLPSVLAMLAVALVALFVLKNLVDIQAGLLAAMMILINPGCWEKGRLAEIDAVYTAFFGIALLLWLFASRRRGMKQIAAQVGAGVCLGLAILAKGPIPVLWFMLLFMWAIAFQVRQKKSFFWGGVLSFCAMVAVALPWFWYSMTTKREVVEVERGEQVEAKSALDVWASQLLERVKPSEDWQWTDSVSVFLEGLVNFLPWTLVLLVFMLPQVKLIVGLSGERARFFSRWSVAFVIGYCSIALLPGSNGRYTMPLTIPVAVLVSIALGAASSWAASQRVRDVLFRGLVGFKWLAWCISILCLLLPLLWYNEALGWRFLWWGLGVVALVMGGRLVACLKDTERWSPFVTATGLLCAGIVGSYASTLNHVGKGSDHLRKMAQEIDSRRTLENPVWLYRFQFKGREGWLYYLQGERRYLPERNFDVELFSTDEVQILTSEKRWKKDQAYLERRLGEVESVEMFTAESDRNKPFVLATFSLQEQVGDSSSHFDSAISAPSARTWASLARERQQQIWHQETEKIAE